jgi:hypothetical protein
MFNRIRFTIEKLLYEKRKPAIDSIPRDTLPNDNSEAAWHAFDAVCQSLMDARGDAYAKVAYLPTAWRMVYSMLTLDSQVNNGGFHQFFANMGGRLDAHLIDDAKLLGNDDYFALISRAFSEYREIDYGEQWDNLGKSWETFTAPYKEGRFNDEDMAYFDTKPPLDELVGAHVRANLTR